MVLIFIGGDDRENIFWTLTLINQPKLISACETILMLRNNLSNLDRWSLDGDSDEWARDELGSAYKLCGFQPVSERERKRMGVVEMVMYNMASFLASFAIGFDVRASNLQPQPVPHPRLQNLSQIQDGEFELAGIHNSPLHRRIYMHEKDILNVGNPLLNRLYGLETYHGPSKQKIR